MDKLKMHSVNKVDENIKIVGEFFPNALTEVIKGYNKDGSAIVEQAIDFDILRQELSKDLVEGPEERYQFTWPDKRKSILLANAPIAKTLRPCREESINFESTENLYIEGDNLDALKMLQETYLGKVKMIYIDPPYNTGKDFVYEDDFAQKADEYFSHSGQFDEEGNRLVQNTESNGRFHTDWLNMIYPRLKLAKDLLTDDGVIFISIDNNEVENLKKICNEVFGERNEISLVANINNPKGRSDDKYVATGHEYLAIYAKSITNLRWYGFEPTEEIIRRYNKTDFDGKQFREIDLRKTGENDLREDRPNLFYYFYYNETSRDFFPSRDELTPEGYIQIKPQREDGREGNWRWGLDTSIRHIQSIYPKLMPTRKIWGVFEKDYIENRSLIKPTSVWAFKDVNSERGSEDFIKLGFDKKVFPKPKPIGTLKRIAKLSTSEKDILMDFFSGSATTAHAVMQLNAEDGGNRKFIMVQLPEATDENSEAYKAGYQNICEIGKERIRRAGNKIADEIKQAQSQLKLGEDRRIPDVGFRVLKVDSTNMQDVYYNPSQYKQEQLGLFADNIKSDRSPEDLLFQVMLDLGILLSSKIEETTIGDKQVFSVAGNYLLACFDSQVTSEVVTAIAKKQPYYAVFRDSGMASDSVAINFEQIFENYSPTTVRKVL